jgi:hypothetical protein
VKQVKRMGKNRQKKKAVKRQYRTRTNIEWNKSKNRTGLGNKRHVGG